MPMRWVAVFCFWLVGTLGCELLMLEPHIEKPEDCGEVRRGYIYNYDHTDSLLVDRERVCWQTAGGWGSGYEDTAVHRDSIPHHRRW